MFFYSGALGVLWWCMWTLTVASTPQQHSTITARERDYIMRTVGKTEHKQVPWSVLLSKRAVWSLVIAHATHNWGFCKVTHAAHTLCLCLCPGPITHTHSLCRGHSDMLLMWLPSYLNDALHFDIKSAGLLSVLPYFCCFLMSNVSGSVSDFLIRCGWPTLTVRRMAQVGNSCMVCRVAALSLTVEPVSLLAQFVGEFFPAALLVGATYVDSIPVVVVFITLCVGISGYAGGGTGTHSQHVIHALHYHSLTCMTALRHAQAMVAITWTLRQSMRVFSWGSPTLWPPFLASRPPISPGTYKAGNEVPSRLSRSPRVSLSDCPTMQIDSGRRARSRAVADSILH